MSSGGSYVFGHSGAELDRLARQARAIDPVTRRFFTEAGVARGMRVLDVGCGGGDVSVLVASMVGAEGSVVGFDRFAAAVGAAAVKVEELGLRNVSFISGALDRLEGHAPFDAVVGRYVLQFVEDPVTFLASLAGFAKPGAPVVFHELDWSGVSSAPPVPTYDRLASQLQAVIERSGADVHSGLRLPSVFIAAGLGDPEVRIEQRAGAASTSAAVVERMVGLASSLAESGTEPGLSAIEQLDLDTLQERIVGEAVAAGSVVRSHFQVGAWCLAP